jgi:cysteine synthase A
MKFKDILGTIGNTPVVRINKLGPKNVKLYVKVEAFNPLGSVKDRLALGVIEAAEKSGALKPGQTVIEATSGNTGIGLAMVCAAKGYPLVVTMAESFSVERRKLMRFLGAKVVLTPAAERASSRTKPTPTCIRGPRRRRSCAISPMRSSTTGSPASAPAAR